MNAIGHCEKLRDAAIFYQYSRTAEVAGYTDLIIKFVQIFVLLRDLRGKGILVFS